MESDIRDINRNIIALPEDEIKRNNAILQDVIFTQIVPKMQQINELFKCLYRNPFFAGSFFCGLKIDHPDEYDLVFLMELPEYVEPTLTLCNVPGFVQIQLKGMKQWAPSPQRPMSQSNVTRTGQRTALPKRSQSNGTRTAQSTTLPRRRPNYKKIRVRSQKIQKLWDNIRYNENLPLTKDQRILLSGLANLLDDDYYLDAVKVSGWIEGIITKTYDFCSDKSDQFTFIKTSEGTLKAELSKSGPAFTLKLRKESNHKPIIIDIDLVPGFVFSSQQWPPPPFRRNPLPDKTEFFIVPKKPNKSGHIERYWRPSFQAQESVLINDMQNLKPCIKLLKRLRDVCDHNCIASYHIKTIFLWELEQNKTLWSKPLKDVFMTMLEKFERIFREGVILNYWNPQDNLIQDWDRNRRDDIANKYKHIIAVLERYPERIVQYFDG